MEKFKNLGKYLISFLLASGLLYYVYKGQNISSLLAELSQTNYLWILLSFLVAILAHVSRAIRWNMLLEPLGYKPSIFNTFNAVMLGYGANFIFPRAGEVARCGILYKSDDIPVDKSIGTVVAERIVDLITMMVFMAVTFLLEFKTLMGFVLKYNQNQTTSDSLFKTYFFYLILFMVVIGAGILYFFRNRILKMKFVKGLMEGILSIKDCKNIPLFIFHSVFIWFCYYLMMYFALKSLPSTSHLSPIISLSLLMISTMGMIIPVPGGIGAYHFLVTEGLVLYGVNKESGAAFAGISHSLQILEIFVLAGFSFFVSSYLISKAKNKKPTDNN